MATIEPAAPLAPNPFATPGGNLRRRRRVDRLMRASSTGAALVAVGILVLVVVSVVANGASQLSINFLVKDPLVQIGPLGGGIANAIVGSLVLVAVAAVMAVPLGVLIAIFLTEFSSARTARPVRLALDLINGLPTIVTAVFVYGLLVAGSGQKGWAASFALAIIMMPLIARTSAEVLSLVPRELRDASHALGVSRWRTIVGIVLPGALGGILTGVVLAVARAAGETAPVLLLASITPNYTTVNVFNGGIPNIPMVIFNGAESGFPADHARAWGAALVLLVLILVGNLGARAMLARQRRRILSR